LLGTPYYMSPEQWGEIPRDGGIEIDGRADIYSLGVVVYEITTGVLPFEKDTAIELRRAHCHEAPRPLENFDASIPLAWSRAVLRAMAKDRSERQRAAGEFARELRQAVSGAAESLPPSFRADAPTIAGTLNETNLSGRGATPQNLAARTVNENDAVSNVQASSSGVAPTLPLAAAAPKRSWTLGLMSSRGCQVSVTVAAMLLIAVMVGGYALMQRFGSGSADRQNAPTAGAQNANASTTAPDTATSNSNTSAAGKSFLTYRLLLSPSALDAQTPALGNEPVAAGQSLQFSFKASEDGFLHMLGEDGAGNPVVMPLGSFIATAAVQAGEETELPMLARIKLNSSPGTETFTVIYSDAALDLPFASEPLPLDGSFRKLTTAEQGKIEKLRQQSAPATVSYRGGQEDGEAHVSLKGERAGRPVVFDIKLNLKR
ncbi:MAG: hypothetical protein H7Y30_02935, partial [Pyrinomonadaceae bacterium]|nr:hypothetical protein [Pyrinomonadaceae bacterium]